MIRVSRERLKCKRQKAKDGSTDGGWDEQEDDREKNKEGERNRERWVVDGSSGTLGWRLQCLCVCECVCALQMSNGL